MQGIYCLLFNLDKDRQICVGSLGMVNFKKGLYVYVGSAQTNLEKRIERHLRPNKKIHWHIDYLTSCESFSVDAVYVKDARKNVECVCAKYLQRFGEPVTGFGSSDCVCISHLIRVEKTRDLKAFLIDLNFRKL